MSNPQTPEPEHNLRSGLRNPRRRPRQSDPDSIKSAPRRKRSKLSENTFAPPRHDDEINGTIEVATTNGDVHPPSSSKRGRGRPRKESVQTLDMEIPLRSKKGSMKRQGRPDGATVLTQNARYSVKMLPSTPKELRREGLEYRGSLGAAHHALAVTRERAFIWDYTSHAPVNNCWTFDVPFALKPSEPLPFGALVANGASPDIGLLLISATSGKIVFYDSIERAASLGLFQDRNAGVEGSLGSLFSGETVTRLVPAEHAGFVITLNSGRIAQLTLRDGQGKARVFTQFLRPNEQSASGLFGSIKGLLHVGAWKRDLVAVHTRPLGTRGQMQAVSLTERAELQIWDLDWSGRYTFKGTMDFRELMQTEWRREIQQPELQGQAETLAMLDFAVLDKPASGTEVATLGAEQPIDLLILFRAGRLDNATHVLAQLSVRGAHVEVVQMLKLGTLQRRASASTQTKARLVLPKPKHTAFVAFEDAMSLVALDDRQAETPEAQLHASYIQPPPFEDTVYLRPDNDLAVLDFDAEDPRGSNASGIAFVKSAGLVRVSVTDPDTTTGEAVIPVKTRMEQAVFHGALQDGNILDFSCLDESLRSSDQIEDAAIAISKEILRSTSPFISTSPTSIEAHLAYKAQAYRALIAHVRCNHANLSNALMWRLLWDAEKVAAAQVLWPTFEQQVANASKKKRTATFLDEVCALVLQHLDPRGSQSQRDSEDVRSFLIHSLHEFERLFPMARHALDSLLKDQDTRHEKKFRLVLEANELFSKSLEAVFSFRAENAAAYGIPPGSIENGILSDAVEYTGLLEFWTSTEDMLKAAVSMASLSRRFLTEEFEDKMTAEQRADMEPMIREIAAWNPRLVELLCRIYQERINWLASRPSQREKVLAETLAENYKRSRYDHFRDQASIAQATAGLELAEKYRDMQTLTEIVVAEVQYSLNMLQEVNAEDKPEILSYIKDIERRVGKYFERFGDEFANAYFDQGFLGSKAGLMLQDAQERWPEVLTKYLRADPSRAKICWINDITINRDFEHASKSLAYAAKEQETMLWNKKVELSMSKLSLLAAQEELSDHGLAINERNFLAALPDDKLKLVYIQEKLYRHLLPELRHCLDRYAEAEVITQKFAFKNQDLHSLKQLLETYIFRLMDHAALSIEELIDVLTLMDSEDDDSVEDNLRGEEFALALKALNAAAPELPQDRFEALLQLIWKRCYLYDDWVEINTANQKRLDVDMTATLRNTMPWRTILVALEEDLFEERVRLVPPSQCLGAGCAPQDLSYRFPNEELLDPILHDNRIQDEQLAHFVTDRSLDEWVQSCVKDVKGYISELAEERSEKARAERQMERGMKKRSAPEANGVNGENGIHDGGEEAHGEAGANGMEGDGDVEMS